MISLIKHCVKALLYGIIGVCVVLVIIFVLFLENRPELKVWHEAELDVEFTTNSPAESFEDYLAVENRLFAQLHVRIDALMKLIEQLILYHEVVFKASRRTVYCEFNIELDLMPNLEFRTTFKKEHEYDNKYNRATDDPV